MFELILPVLRSRKFQLVVVSGLVTVAGYVGLELSTEEIMSWLVSNFDSIIGVAGTVYGLWQSWRARNAKKDAKKLAADLDAIRAEAGTKAPHEK